jgi:YD repeat-containing protein
LFSKETAMLDLLGILLLLIFPAKPKPTTEIFFPHGIVPYFYSREDGIKIPSVIPNLIKTGVYRIEETDSAIVEFYPRGLMYIYDLTPSLNKDTLYIITSIPDLKKQDTDIYLSSGVKLKSYSTHDPIEAALKLNNLPDRETRDTSNEGERSKTIVRHNRLMNETKAYMYQLVTSDRPTAPIFDGSVEESVRDSIEKQYHEDIEKWAEQNRAAKDEYWLDEVFVRRVDSINHILENINYEFERNGDTSSIDHRKYYYDKYHRHIKMEEYSSDGKTIFSQRTEYKDAANGYLLSKMRFDNDTLTSEHIWKYDKHWRCILNKGDGSTREWKYDAKGNLIEYTERMKDKLQFKNTFNIFYK